MRDFKRQQDDISSYQKSQTAVEDLNKKKRELLESSENTAKAVDVLNKELLKEEQKLVKLNDRLRESGVDTNNLTAENEKLGKKRKNNHS
jgi:hypothetical protein